MFDFIEKWKAKRSNQAAYELGEKVSKAILEAVDQYLEQRIAEVSDSLLEVYSERLETLTQDQNLTPEQIAAVELSIFAEHCDELEPRMKKELEHNLPDWLELAAEAGITDLLNEYVSQKFEKAKEALGRTAAQLTAETLKSISLKKLTSIMDDFDK
jgi:hypothetical protein